MTDIIVAKIGGSTLGDHDTTLADVAELARRGARPVIVHGGGALINDWLERLGVPTKFEKGLRVTDACGGHSVSLGRPTLNRKSPSCSSTPSLSDPIVSKTRPRWIES